MNSSENIICFSSIDWDFIWQGHQQIMQTFANQGHRVLFIENTGVRSPGIKDISRIKKRFSNWHKGTYGIRQIHENLYVYSPLLLPFPYSKIALYLNTFIFRHHLNRWLTIMDFQNPIVWSFLPTAITQKILSQINKKITVYYCIDKFSESSKAAQKILKDEKTMLKQSDLIFATSHKLIEYCSKHNTNVHFFPFGVDFDHFAHKTYSEKPSELKSTPHPIIGYVGGIHRWIDLDLIFNIASQNPQFNFVFVGPIQTDISPLKTLKNVHFISKKEKEDLPHYIYFFDTCIIPYKLSPYTDNVYPTKLNEYLAIGKKVFSTALEEIIYFNKHHGNPITIVHSAQELSDILKKYLEESNPKPLSQYVEIAKLNSWTKRIEGMTHLIDQKIIQNELEKNKNWVYRLKKLYKNYPVKITLSLTCLFLLYYSIFHTSLVWHLAQPLTVHQPLQKSDVILALGGGVGESGQAGQGYQERVTTAVELYQKGYAHHIIFSSGYAYLLKEAQVMKELAMSLGVPEQNIDIEDKAGNTYENIKFSSDIIKSHHFKNIIIVSSPYHLKRTQLVAQKQFPKDIKFILSPVRTSMFFDSLKENINFSQIKTLIHEYAALIYYKFKYDI